jgi:hypothetical protein
MSDQSASATALAGTGGDASSRDFLPGARPAGGPEQPAAPWVELSKADCLLWAMALHRAAVAARLSGGGSK